ncbi:hypothetical protein JHK85_010348 [Glycine max]|uniref:Cellulose synthase A catalytic subunit 8 [UDP-forming] n=1 Tax=Glycine soja TaxID=3848 RepID=A0A0B2QPM7_GLYSO|nr:hypothetical protein JHK85_010348 [Glycine max]KHN23486.1 Cellulose synthase A catalytic subunit 8 [UDP-forming] [Glycine soja]
MHDSQKREPKPITSAEMDNAVAAVDPLGELCIHNTKDRRQKCQHYIQTWGKESQRQVYLGGYLNQAHRQLVVLCPRDNIVVWFCSLRKKPDDNIKATVNNAMKTTTTTLEGKLDPPVPQWIEPKVSREKRPGYRHHKKVGAENALVRVSVVLTNAPFILNLDCHHYVNNSKAVREAMCFLMDPEVGRDVCYVQFL